MFGISFETVEEEKGKVAVADAQIFIEGYRV